MEIHCEQFRAKSNIVKKRPEKKVSDNERKRVAHWESTEIITIALNIFLLPSCPREFDRSHHGPKETMTYRFLVFCYALKKTKMSCMESLNRLNVRSGESDS